MLRSLFKIGVTIYFWSLSTVAVLTSATISAISYPFVSQKSFARIFESVTCHIIIYGMGIPGIWNYTINDSRREKIPLTSDSRYILIANHLSFIDTIVVALLPIKKKFMMARIFSKIPIFGHLCRASGHIMIDKDDKSTTRPAVMLATKAMEDGCSFMIYPEGKRGKTSSELLEFKTGAYRLAQDTGVPILPIALKGVDIALPIGGIISPASIELTIGDPIFVGPDKEDLEEAIKKSRNFMLGVLKN